MGPMMSPDFHYSTLLALYGDFEVGSRELGPGVRTMASLMWRSENLEVLRGLDAPVLSRLADDVDAGVASLEASLAVASDEPGPSGYCAKDEVIEVLRSVRGLQSGAQLVLSHLADPSGDEHPFGALIRHRDEKLAAEAAEAELWAGYEKLRELDDDLARFDDGPLMWNVLNALVEVGVPMHLLRSSVISAIYCHIGEPGATLCVDADPDLADVLDCIGLPYSIDDGDLVLESDGLGWNYKTGMAATESLVPPGLDGRRLVTTRTLDQVHLALLACSDRYWSLIPARMLTPTMMLSGLPTLFGVESLDDIPRASIRDLALSYRADLASPTLPLPACMH